MTKPNQKTKSVFVLICLMSSFLFWTAKAAYAEKSQASVTSKEPTLSKNDADEKRAEEIRILVKKIKADTEAYNASVATYKSQSVLNTPQSEPYNSELISELTSESDKKADMQRTLKRIRAAKKEAEARLIDQELSQKYKNQLKLDIEQFLKSNNFPPSSKCELNVSQIRGGEITGVLFYQCSLNYNERNFVIDTLLGKSLTYANYESVFIPRLQLTLCDTNTFCTQ